MPIMKDYQTLICRTERDGIDIVMTYITEKEEIKLDKGEAIKITRNDKTFNIPNGRDNVICYGHIDFNINSDDYYQLQELIHFNKVVHIPIDYDLKTHTCRSPIKRYRSCECSNIAEVCRYAYGVLGKPDRVLIFKTR